ncbi:MAG: MBOAT family O-acyltransferase [Leptolyngbyaceae bacterium]|nr:MBOAT family O-acyltransferase [Leptolyngbyaceae bacterium]
MFFNSFTFVAFFFLVYCSYLFLKSHYKAQNLLLLISSYIFYGYWDARFLLLLAFSTGVDYCVGRWLEQYQSIRLRRIFLALSILSNLAVLIFFKYFNFFSLSIINLLSSIGLNPDPLTLNIILPVGISFYTFQTLSYSIDVYKGKISAEKNLINFALFVSFFPQLVAGPIERASTLLPQISKPRFLNVDQINAGLFLILWGYFKKLVIADNLGGIADEIFESYTTYEGLDLLIGSLAFTVQIYGDFSGYSDIARGLAKLMGFDFMLNFNLPFFATSPSNFWARWHISLSTWFRDYVYIPLGGNRLGAIATYRNLTVTMLLCGLWHGAAWNFILWGAFHGMILIGYRMAKPYFLQLPKWLISNAWITSLLGMGMMIFLTTIGWILFRSSNLQQAFYILTNINFSSSSETSSLAHDLLFFSLPLLIVQIYQFISQDLLILTKLSPWLRVFLYGGILSAIIVFSSRDRSEFIYFQF